MENLGKFTLFVAVLVAAFFTSLLGAYTVISIATLYKIIFITEMNFIQVYGVLTLITLIQYKYKKTDKNITISEVIKNSATEVFTKITFLLLSWGLAFLSYSIIS